MTNIVIVVEGLALWVDRGVYWEVLFPKPLLSAHHHIPKVTVEVDGAHVLGPAPIGPGAFNISHLAEANGCTFRPVWMLPIAPAPNAPVHNPGMATTAVVEASFRLPKLDIQQVSSQRLGPVLFEGREYFLDFGTLMRFDAVNPVLTISYTGSGTAGTHTFTSNPASSKIEITIQNRTAVEHGGTFKDTRRGDPLNDVHDVFALCYVRKGSPRYLGDDLVPPSGVAASGPVAVRTYPFKLCPQLYLDDDA